MFGVGFFFSELVPWHGPPCRQAGVDTWCGRACKGRRRPKQRFLGAVSHCTFPSYVVKLHLGREQLKSLVPQSWGSLLLRCCGFQISIFRWAKPGLFYLHMLADICRGLGNDSQISCSHLQCGTFGAVAGKKYRISNFVVQV